MVSLDDEFDVAWDHETWRFLRGKKTLNRDIQLKILKNAYASSIDAPYRILKYQEEFKNWDKYRKSLKYIFTGEYKQKLYEVLLISLSMQMQFIWTGKISDPDCFWATTVLANVDILFKKYYKLADEIVQFYFQNHLIASAYVEFQNPKQQQSMNRTFTSSNPYVIDIMPKSPR